MKIYWLHFWKKASRGGFSLTEVAIAIGVVALVLGGVWAAASAVRKQHNMEIETNRLTQISRTVRDLYAGKPGVIRPTTEAAQVAENLFPQDMLVGGSPKNVWGGAVEIRMTPCCHYAFSIVYNGLDDETCFAFLSRIQGSEDKALTVTYVDPEPAFAPPAESTQGGEPRRVFFQRPTDDQWVDMTRKSQTAIPFQGCKAFGAFFTF